MLPDLTPGLAHTYTPTPRPCLSPQLEKERASDLGAGKAAELEVSAPTLTAAAAAAASAFGGGSQVSVGGGGGGGEEEEEEEVNRPAGGARSGRMNGLEVLWECVLDDVPGDGARWVLVLARERSVKCRAGLGWAAGYIHCNSIVQITPCVAAEDLGGISWRV